jgi:Protein of unknown function (DUF4199)
MNTAPKIGIIAGLILSIYIFCIRHFDLTQNKFAGFGIFLIIVLAAIISCQLMDKETNYQAGFAKIFSGGFATTASATFITVSITLLSYALVPSFKQTEIAELKMQYAQKKMDASQIDKQIAETESHFYSIKSSQYLFPLLLSGSLFSLLGSLAISAKNKRNR